MRFLKRFLYGLLYLSILAGIGTGIYFAFLVPAPSCFDGIKNQLEEDIDCGPSTGSGQVPAGGCMPCELKNLKMTVGEPRSFALSELTTSLATEVENPSANYGLNKFEYTYDIYASGNFLLRSVRGESSLYPSEKKYLVISGIDIDKRRIGRIEIMAGDMNWVPKAELIARPRVSIAGESISQSQISEPAAVSGTVENASTATVGSLRVVAFGYGTDGALSAVSTYEISELPPFSSAGFKIFLPAGKYSRFETKLEFSP